MCTLRPRQFVLAAKSYLFVWDEMMRISHRRCKGKNYRDEGTKFSFFCDITVIDMCM